MYQCWNYHNEEKKIRHDFLDLPQSTQNDPDQFDDIISAANNLTEIDYEDFKLSEETYDNLSCLDYGEADDNIEIETTVIDMQESLQSKIFVLENKVKELENNEKLKDLTLVEKRYWTSRSVC